MLYSFVERSLGCPSYVTLVTSYCAHTCARKDFPLIIARSWDFLEIRCFRAANTGSVHCCAISLSSPFPQNWVRTHTIWKFSRRNWSVPWIETLGIRKSSLLQPIASENVENWSSFYGKPIKIVQDENGLRDIPRVSGLNFAIFDSTRYMPILGNIAIRFVHTDFAEIHFFFIQK